MNITKEIEELQKKAVKYDNLRERNLNYIKKINEVIETLTNLKKEIDPFGTSQERTRRNMTDVRKEIFTRLEGGEEFTVEKLMNEYNLTDKQPYALIRQIMKNRNIQKRTEGRVITIYAQKVV